MKRLVCSLIVLSVVTASITANASSYSHGKNHKYQQSSIYNSDEPKNSSHDKGHDYFPMHRDTHGKRVFIFDPNYHAWAAYNENGKRVNVGKASGGKLYCPDTGHGCKTVTGTFRVISKEGAGCISHKFPIKTHGGSPMPYCMYFHPKGYAIHGSHEVPDDANASHGCIRITPAAAKWLNKNFMTIGTTVIVLPYHRH